MAISFDTIKVDSMSRGVGPDVAQEFVDAVIEQLKQPAYKVTGFSIDASELKKHLGYTGSAKLSSLVWAINTKLDSLTHKTVRAGVRSKGSRVAFYNWSGVKRVVTRTKKEAKSA